MGLIFLLYGNSKKVIHIVPETDLFWLPKMNRNKNFYISFDWCIYRSLPDQGLICLATMVRIIYCHIFHPIHHLFYFLLSSLNTWGGCTKGDNGKSVNVGFAIFHHTQTWFYYHILLELVMIWLMNYIFAYLPWFTTLELLDGNVMNILPDPGLIRWPYMNRTEWNPMISALH